jgi:hypothetical protein
MHKQNCWNANNEDNWDHGSDGLDIVQMLEIGDNFTINVAFGNEENYELYVACCVKIF